MYKEDFSIERRDRERAQSEKDYLQQQLTDAQDVIATLTQEVFNSNIILSEFCKVLGEQIVLQKDTCRILADSEFSCIMYILQ